MILGAMVKRFLGGIVVSDPDPQYSALDRMDGLDRACTKVRPPKPLNKPAGKQVASNRGGRGGDPSLASTTAGLSAFACKQPCGQCNRGSF